MKKWLVGAAALLTALTGSLAVATPAAADGWHGGYHGGGYGWHGGWRHDGDGGALLAAGIAGLAIGAALTAPRHDYYYYDGPRYAYAPAYVYGPPPGYYVGRSYWGWYGGCRREWVWTGWGYRPVTACY